MYNIHLTDLITPQNHIEKRSTSHYTHTYTFTQNRINQRSQNVITVKFTIKCLYWPLRLYLTPELFSLKHMMLPIETFYLYLCVRARDSEININVYGELYFPRSNTVRTAFVEFERVLTLLFINFF